MSVWSTSNYASHTPNNVLRYQKQPSKSLFAYMHTTLKFAGEQVDNDVCGLLPPHRTDRFGHAAVPRGALGAPSQPGGHAVHCPAGSRGG